jgi:hypothetical protein
LDRVRNGQEPPGTGPQQLALATFCGEYTKEYVAAVRFYTSAFAAAPELTTAPRSLHRFDAACDAILAANGQGRDASALRIREKAQLRRQALAWLQTDLEHYRRLIQPKPDPASSGVLQKLAESPGRANAATITWIAGQLQRWQTVPDLASVREEKALTQLPSAEQKEWRKLWADVQTLRRMAG